jgi:hypothetical protein
MHKHVLFALTFTLPCLAGCGASHTDPTDTSTSPLESQSRNDDPIIPVYLNHTFVMLSQATYDALATDAYLNDTFVNVQIRTTQSTLGSYTGTYFNFERTYVENMAVGTLGYPAGVYGIVLTNDVAGGFDQLWNRWNTQFGAANVLEFPVSRTVNGVDTPWFLYVQPTWSWNANYTAIGGIQYDPAAGSTTPITRAQNLASLYDPTKLAHNITDGVYAVPATDWDLTQQTFTSAGWTVRPEGPAGFEALSPSDPFVARRVHAVPATSTLLGTLGVRISLNRYDRHCEQLGDALLEVGVGGQKAAEMWYVPPTPELRAALEHIGD